TYIKNQNQSSWQNSPMFGLYLFPTGDDLSKYEANGGGVWSPTRGFYVQNWPYLRKEHSLHQNPYWVVNKMQNDEINQRSNITGSVKYDITGWLNVEGRTTFNFYHVDN